jgi:RNA polymerase sigma factor (TIGR02999 family)
MDATLIARADAIDGAVAGDQLFDRLYARLHRLARREVYRQGSFGNLGATTLVHEAYLKVSGTEGSVFPDCARFMAYVARAMRGLIIDDVRRRQSQKRGGLLHITSLAPEHDHEHDNDLADSRTIPKLADALDELALADPRLAEIIELKFFGGLSFAEIAAMRGVSERTVQRDWNKGRLYLHRALSDQGQVRESSAATPAAVQ